MGTFFGSDQAALNAFGGSFGAAETAGLLYSALGVTSAIGALSVAYWPASFSHPARWVTASAVMAALSFLLLLPQTAAPMIGVLLVLGFPVGPVMVTIFSIGGMLAPPERMGTVMTLLSSGVVAGTAIGSAAAGTLAQNFGYAAAFAVPIAASCLMLLLSLAAALMVRRRNAAGCSRRSRVTSSSLVAANCS